MTGRIYIRDLEILLNLQIELSQFNHGVSRIIDEVSQSITNTKKILYSRTEYWNTELRRREAALKACQHDRDRNCNAEITAVYEAKEALERLRKLHTEIEQAIGEYQPYANRLKQSLDSKISKAKGDLQRSIEKYQSYLAYDSLSKRESGYRTHGYEYQKERHKFILNSLREHPFLTKVGKNIRGELTTNIRRTGEHSYIASPKGYHVGHKIPGWNHWSNFRWEGAYENSYRGGKFKR